MTSAFIQQLRERGWQFVPSRAVPLRIFPPRYKSIPEELRLFVGTYDSLCNQKEDRWFLSATDYNSVRVEGFNWNEYEHMSLQAAGTDSTWAAQVTSFWSAHLPIYMRVDGDYEYAAYCCSGDNEGSYVRGIAPEFEEPSVVAHNLTQFQNWVLNENT